MKCRFGRLLSHNPCFVTRILSSMITNLLINDDIIISIMAISSMQGNDITVKPMPSPW